MAETSNSQAVLEPPAGGLKKGVLSPLDTLAQSVAGIAPSATPGMLIPIVFGFAGNGTWLAYLLATVGILFTTQCINEFASRSACPGSLYTFVSNGFGRRAGILTGWALLFAYVVCGACCITEFALYALSLAKHFFNLQLSSFSMMLLSAGIVAYIAMKNIKLSATLMLWLEFISISLILVVVTLTIGAHGGQVDTNQLALKGVGVENVRQGLVMAIFSFVAFESAASLGSEAKDPLHNIPRALMRSVMISGGFFVICAYAMVMSFAGLNVDLSKCSTPLLTMSQLLKMPDLGHFIDVGIMMSFFAAGLANLNAGARALYKMSEDGLFWSNLSRTHSTNQTPHIAAALATTTSLAIAIALAARGCALMDIVGWTGTLATFGFIYAYMATSISAAKMLKKENALTAAKKAIITMSLCVLAFALIGSLYPPPAAPYNILPFIFIAYMVVGAIRTAQHKEKAPSPVPSP